MPSKDPHEIIIFGDPEDREVALRVIQFARGGITDGASQRCVFDSTKHDAFISENKCYLHDTAGLSASGLKKNEAKDALISLYDFTGTLLGGVHLLVYVVRNQPNPENYKLFHKILFQNQIPIILITTEPPTLLDASMPFDDSLSLHSLSESQKSDRVQNILEKHVNRSIWKPEGHIPWFAETAWQSWDLLKDSTKWTIDDCIAVLSQAMEQRHRLSKRLVMPIYKDITTHIKKNCLYNIIVFGSTGAGKTSLINMLAGRELEPASTNANGGTLESKPYRVEIRGTQYHLHDTIGLNGAPNCEEATQGLSELLRTVNGGVHLLVYVTTPRVKSSDPNDYNIFYKGICLGEVPIVVVVTHVDSSREVWWEHNKDTFTKQGMSFSGHACINTRGEVVDGKYKCDENSKREVEDLLVRDFPRKGWKIKDKEYPGRLGEVVQSVWRVFMSLGVNWNWKTYRGQLMKYLGGEHVKGELQKLKEPKKK